MFFIYFFNNVVPRKLILKQLYLIHMYALNLIHFNTLYSIKIKKSTY